MKNARTLIYLLVILFCLPGSAVADDPVELPPITVVAPATDGSNILCQGQGCWLVLMSTQGAYAGFDDYTDLAQKLEPAQVDRQLFCSYL